MGGLFGAILLLLASWLSSPADSWELGAPPVPPDYCIADLSDADDDSDISESEFNPIPVSFLADGAALVLVAPASARAGDFLGVSLHRRLYILLNLRN